MKVPFVLPAIEWGERWEVAIDTRTAAAPEIGLPTGAGERYVLEARSMAVLRLCRKQEPGARAVI